MTAILEVTGADRVRKTIARIRKRFPTEAARAVSDGQRRARTAYIRAIRGPDGLTTLSNKKAQSLVILGPRPRAGRLSAVVWIKRDPITIRHFKVRKLKTGISAKVYRARPPVKHPAAFLLRSGAEPVWATRIHFHQGLPSQTRRGNPIRESLNTRHSPSLVQRLPIIVLTGPRLTGLLQDRSLRKKVEKAGLDSMQQSMKKRWERLKAGR